MADRKQWMSVAAQLEPVVGAICGPLAAWKSDKSLDMYKGGEPVTIYAALQGQLRSGLGVLRYQQPSQCINIIVDVYQGAEKVTFTRPMRAAGIRMDVVATQVVVRAERYALDGRSPDDDTPALIAAAILEGPQPRPIFTQDTGDAEGEIPQTPQFPIPEFAQLWRTGIVSPGGVYSMPIATFWDVAGNSIAQLIAAPPGAPIPADAFFVSFDASTQVTFE